MAVRAGAITPSKQDEETFRKQIGLNPISPEVAKAWEEDKGIRRPITLVQKIASAMGIGQQSTTQDDEDDPD